MQCVASTGLKGNGWTLTQYNSQCSLSSLSFFCTGFVVVIITVNPFVQKFGDPKNDWFTLARICGLTSLLGSTDFRPLLDCESLS